MRVELTAERSQTALQCKCSLKYQLHMSALSTRTYAGIHAQFFRIRTYSGKRVDLMTN